MSSDREAQGDVTKPKAGHALSRLMTEQKNRAAEGLHRLACVVRNTALAQNEVGGQIGNYSNRTAARLDSMATYVRGADFPTILRDAGQFARRPEVLLGGTIVTGLLVARFLKTSKRGAAEPWSSAARRWHEALQKSAQVVSSLADTRKQGAEVGGLNPEAVVETVTGSQLGKHIAIAGDRLMVGKHENDNVVEKRSRGGQEAIR